MNDIYGQHYVINQFCPKTRMTIVAIGQGCFQINILHFNHFLRSYIEIYPLLIDLSQAHFQWKYFSRFSYNVISQITSFSSSTTSFNMFFISSTRFRIWFSSSINPFSSSRSICFTFTFTFTWCNSSSRCITYTLFTFLVD